MSANAQITEYTYSALSMKPPEQFNFSSAPREFPACRPDGVSIRTTDERVYSGSSIQPPEQFNFSKPEEFPAWKRRYDRYRNLSHLNRLSDADQVDYLCYIMGPESEEILTSFHLTAAEKEDYCVVSRKFDEYFSPKRNVIYERAVFNRRLQEEGESVADFVTALHKLSETCEYGALTNELIRDRIVVGISDTDVSYNLQLKADLTLQSATQFAKLAETVKKQLGELRKHSTYESSVDAINHHHKPSYTGVPPNSSVAKNSEPAQSPPNSGAIKNTKPTQSQPNSSLVKNIKPVQSQPNPSKPNQEKCWRCGNICAHARRHCPARNATCDRCFRRSHFAKACPFPPAEQPKNNRNRKQAGRQYSERTGELLLVPARKKVP